MYFLEIFWNTSSGKWKEDKNNKSNQIPNNTDLQKDDLHQEKGRITKLTQNAVSRIQGLANIKNLCTAFSTKKIPSLH